MAVGNLVRYLMISCYLGWFFRPGIARTTVAAQFAVLLPDTSAAAAAATWNAFEDSWTPWTFGLAVAVPSDTQEILMRRADDDLYVQKSSRAD